MGIEVSIADRGMIRSVLEQLREVDRRELEATGCDLVRLPDVIQRHKVFCFCAWEWAAGPVAIWGLTQQRQGVGAGFAFGTDLWGQALIPMIHHIRGWVLPFLRQSAFHRVEAAALAHRKDVARFMELIGANPEAVLRGYGTNGEDFISYRWLADERRSAQSVDNYARH